MAGYSINFNKTAGQYFGAIEPFHCTMLPGASQFRRGSVINSGKIAPSAKIDCHSRIYVNSPLSGKLTDANGGLASGQTVCLPHHLASYR